MSIKLETEILKTMPERISVFNVGVRLADYAATHTQFLNKANLSKDDYLFLCYYLLLFIEENNICSLPCGYQDILRAVNSFCKTNNVNTDTEALTANIINECFQNNGTILYENTSFLAKKIPIKLIDTTYKDKKTTYSITDSCRKWLYSSYEIEQVGHISLGLLIIEKAIASGRFDIAKNTVNKVDKEIINNIEAAEEMRNEISSNVYQFDTSDILASLKKTRHALQAQEKEINDLQGYFDSIINEDSISSLKNETKFIEAKDDIDYVKEKLKDILSHQLKLIKATQDVDSTFREELKRFPSLNNTKYINIKKDVLSVMKHNPTTSYNIIDMFSSVFNVRFPKIFNLNKILDRQIVYTERGDEEPVEIKKEELLKIANIAEEKKNIYIKECQTIIFEIFKNVVSNTTIRLSSMLNSTLCHNLPLLKDILIIYEAADDGTMTFVQPKKGKTIKAENIVSITKHVGCYHPEWMEKLKGKQLVANFDEKSILEIKDENGNILKIEDIVFSLKDI